MTVRRTSNFKRRNRPNNRRSNFSKNGLDNSPKGRGSVSKILEKYLTMAYDANSNGDRIRAEGLFQHAEHYQRVINSLDKNKEEQEESSKNLSRTQRAITEKNKRLEKNNHKNERNFEEKKISETKKISASDATLDGVEALKAFTTIEDK